MAANAPSIVHGRVAWANFENEIGAPISSVMSWASSCGGA